MKHTGIHHVSINVRDLERSRAFYRDIIGLKEIDRPQLKTEGAWFEVGSGGQQLHLILYPGETLRTGGIDTSDGHFAIRVESYSETVEWLKSRGVEFVANPHSATGFPQIYVIDPDRNIIEINAERLDEGLERTDS